MPPSPPHGTATGEQPTLDPEVLVTCASISLRTSAFSDAHALLTAALAMDADQPRAWGMLGLTLDRMNRKDEARDAYERAVAQGDRDPNTLLDLAQLYVDAAEDDRARSLLSWILVEVDHAPITKQHALRMLQMLEARR